MPQIQYVPGPFSFLAEFGKAGGAAFASAEDQRRRRRDEDYNVAQLIMRGVEAGYLPRSTLSSKETSGLMGRLFSGYGEGPPTAMEAVPNPEEPLARARTQYFEGVDTESPEGRLALSTGRVPSKVETGTETLQAGALEAGGAAGRAVAQVPTEQLAGAVESAAVGEAVSKDAARIVDEAIGGLEVTEKNFDAILDKAVNTYLTTQGEQATMTPDLARRYFATALKSRQLEQFELRTRRTGAERQFAGQQLDPQYLRILLDNVRTMTGTLNAIPAPDPTERLMASALEGKLQQMKTPEERAEFEQSPAYSVMKAAYDRVQQYDQFAQSIASMAAGTQSAVNQRLSEGRLAGQPPGAETGRFQTNVNVEGMAQAIVDGTASAADLADLLQRQKISQVTYDQVVNLIAEKRASQQRDTGNIIQGTYRPPAPKPLGPDSVGRPVSDVTRKR